MAVVCAAALALPVAAQTRGVPASVTSFGFGGRPGFGGVPASVTSPGFGVAPGFVPHGGFRGGRGLLHRPGGFFPGRNNGFFGGTSTPFFPVSVPVAVPYFGYFDYSDVQQQAQPALAAQPQPIIIVVPEHVAGAADVSQQQPASSPEIIERQGDRYVRRGSEQPQAQAPAKPQPPPPPTIIVLRNGQELELTDYAVTGDILYDLSNGRTKKISLAQVDVPATIKLNEDRGIEFSLPLPR